MSIVRPIVSPLVRQLVGPLVSVRLGAGAYVPPATPLVWFRPDVASTIWQDSALTTPGAVDSPIGGAIVAAGVSVGAAAATRPILRQSGGLYYAEFDGTDDALISLAAMDLSAIGAVTVVAAARKLQDTNTNRRVFNHGLASAGDFALRGTDAAGQGRFVAASHGGTRLTAVTPSSYAAPITAVVAMQARLQSTPLLRLRVNQGDWSSNTESQGVATAYSNRTFGIGGSNTGKSVWPGWIYQLFVFAGVLSDTDLADVEAYCASRCGVTL